MSMRKISTAFALLLVCAFSSAQATDLWFHVTIDETDEGTNVSVNLPLSLVEKALSLIPSEVTESSNIMLGDQQFTANDLRELWRSVQETPDMDFVTVQGRDEDLRVSKTGGYLTILGTANNSDGSDIDVRLPFAVVDALLDTEDSGQLNIAGALQALAAHGEGELATITADEAHVRVWIDSSPESR